MQRKVFKKYPTYFHDKVLEYLKGMHLKVIKTIYGKPSLKILNEKKMLEFILLKSAVIQGFPLFPLHFCVVLGLLATSIKHEKKMYWIELGKRSQMSLMCKQYGIIYNRAKNILKKTSRNNQKFQESFRIQNHLTEISSLSVHQQK